MKKLLKIHGNCQKYKFNQSHPSKDGGCVMNEIKYVMDPLGEGCDCFIQVKK